MMRNIFDDVLISNGDMLIESRLHSFTAPRFHRDCTRICIDRKAERLVRLLGGKKMWNLHCLSLHCNRMSFKLIVIPIKFSHPPHHSSHIVVISPHCDPPKATTSPPSPPPMSYIPLEDEISIHSYDILSISKLISINDPIVLIKIIILISIYSCLFSSIF